MFAGLAIEQGGRWYFHPEDRSVLKTEEGRYEYEVVNSLKLWAERVESDLCALAELADKEGLLGIEHAAP